MKLLFAIVICGAAGAAPAQDKPVVDLRGKEGIPKDLKVHDPKPPRVQRTEPPPPAPPERRPQRRPGSVAAPRG